MDEAKANLRAPLPLRQLAEITDFNLFLTTSFDSFMESALNEIRKKEIESLTYSPTDRQGLPAGKDFLPPTVYHLFGTLDVSPTYAVSREDLLERIYAMESQPGSAGMWLRQELGRRGFNLFFIPFAAALVSAVIAGTAVLLGVSRTPALCSVAPAMTIVPGVPGSMASRT